MIRLQRKNTLEDDEESDYFNRNDLHAKLFITEHGDLTKVYTGSANATNSAFILNTEFMVELNADKKFINIDSFLSTDKNLFGSVIKEYRRGELEESNPEIAKLEALTNKVRNALSSHQFSLKVLPGDETGTHKMVLLW
jgi:phosphatidylserine/phosphatidylglycerophosphate/cardiolipin synthase-like enzyme